jgi:Flp pilus assembly protein TadG
MRGLILSRADAVLAPSSASAKEKRCAGRSAGDEVAQLPTQIIQVFTALLHARLTVAVGLSDCLQGLRDTGRLRWGMMYRCDKAREPSRSFLGATGGVAAVEFALLVPFLFLLFLGSVDISQALSADRRLNSLTGSLSELVARRAIGETSRTEIIDYFSISDAVMRPFDVDRTGMRITIGLPVSENQAEVISSAAANGMVAREPGELIDVPSGQLILAAGRCIVMAEGQYPFVPLFGMVFQSDVPLSQRSYSVPRFTSEICNEAETICAGYSSTTPGRNCNDRHNSWGTGNGAGGGITNNNNNNNNNNR